jgi:hypothetical protein
MNGDRGNAADEVQNLADEVGRYLLLMESLPNFKGTVVICFFKLLSNFYCP